MAQMNTIYPRKIDTYWTIVTTLRDGERMISPFCYPTQEQAELAASRCHPDIKAEVVIFMHEILIWNDYK